MNPNEVDLKFFSFFQCYLKCIPNLSDRLHNQTAAEKYNLGHFTRNSYYEIIFQFHHRISLISLMIVAKDIKYDIYIS